MANKKSFVFRIDEDLYKVLEKWAADEFRSVNGQMEWLVSQKLRELGRLNIGKEDPSGSRNRRNDAAMDLYPDHKKRK